MKNSLLLLFCVAVLTGCSPHQKEAPQRNPPDWKHSFGEILPLLGHRNWILVVDKAFPQQTNQGIWTVNTGENLIPVLQYVLEQLESSTHVKPVIYRDAELAFLTPEMVPGVEAFRDSSALVFQNYLPESIFHDSVFTRIDEAARLFRVVVLKTEETIPYSSVFLFLDCKYWCPEDEIGLRLRMGS